MVKAYNPMGSPATKKPAKSGQKHVSRGNTRKTNEFTGIDRMKI
jgi:hypothetical protein